MLPHDVDPGLFVRGAGGQAGRVDVLGALQVDRSGELEEGKVVFKRISIFYLFKFV